MAESKLDPFQTINPPIHRASTVLYETYETYETFLEADQAPYHGKLYGTFGSPVQLELEKALAELEGAYACRVCHSGFDAIGVVLMAFTQSGDHILVCDNIYGPTRAFCDRVLAKYRVDVDYVPPTIGADIERFIKPNTKLIYLESPGSNTFELQDVPAVVEVARTRGIVTVLDNTWATPIFFKPFEHGVDISIHSGSKYIAGHSDALQSGPRRRSRPSIPLSRSNHHPAQHRARGSRRDEGGSGRSYRAARLSSNALIEARGSSRRAPEEKRGCPEAPSKYRARQNSWAWGSRAPAPSW